MTSIPLSPFGRVDWPETSPLTGDRRPVRRPRIRTPRGVL